MKWHQEESHWKAKSYLALDLETTGFDLRKDEIISIGYLNIEEGIVLGASKSYFEIKPNLVPSVQSMQIHGLRAADLADARTMKELIPDLRDRMKGKSLVAHAAWVERAFLKPHLGRFFPTKVIDTAALARACGYGANSTNHEPSLEFLARQLNLPVFTPHHALGDALTTAVVFLALANELERKHNETHTSDFTFKELHAISESYGFHR